MAGESDFFLKIDGVDGESQDDKHKKEIQIKSFSMGVTNAHSASANTGSGVGKAHFHDIAITKQVDGSTPNIMINCATGKHHKTAVITARSAGEKPHEYLKINLEEVFISGYQLHATDNGKLPTEHFTLSYSTIEQEHKVQTAQGTAGAANKKKFDLKKHKHA